MASNKEKSITVSINPRSITFFALGLLAACGQAMSTRELMEFKCNSPSPPFEKGQSYTIMLNPGSNYVAVGQYQFGKVSVSQAERQQGWRRWRTNSDRYGNANSWSELNIKTGELRYIGNKGQVELRSRCLQVK